MPESVDTHQYSDNSDDVVTLPKPVHLTPLLDSNHKTQDTRLKTQDTRHVEPIRKGDLRALVDLLKKGDFLTTNSVKNEDITRRDIIEYVYTRLMAYALDQAATKILSFNLSAEPVEKLHQEILDVILDIDTLPDGLRFTPTQRETFGKAMHFLIDDLATFSADLQSESEDTYVRKHLGTRFQELPEGSYTFDAKTYPGAVVVRIPSKEHYYKLAPEYTQGVYNPVLGEGKLKGRVLVVRGTEPPDKTIEYHEYLHFLNNKLMHFEPLPLKEKQAEAKVETQTKPFERILNELEIERLKIEYRKFNEMRVRGKATDAVRQQLKRVLQRIDKYEQAKDVAEYFAHAEVTTYGDVAVKNAFKKVRDELQAYAMGGNEIPRNFVTSTLGSGFADTLSKTTQGKLFLLELGVLKEILLEAASTDLDPQEVGFLISGARNLSQAAKFVYLHLMQAPRRKLYLST